MRDPKYIYREIIKAAGVDGEIEHFQMGLTWSSCRIKQGSASSVGFAMSPQEKTRLLSWPGTLVSTSVAQLAERLLSWDNFAATSALAACNAAINNSENTLLHSAKALPRGAFPHLAVFDYFRPWLQGQKIVVIGRYPNMECALEGLNYQVLERQPQGDDLPDSAAEFILPQADWVFITATSIINKTFPRLCALSKNAVSVLMGPSTPWLDCFSQLEVDFLAGIQLLNTQKAEQIAAEGGGVRLFAEGVQYALANISQQRLGRLKNQIGACAGERERLKAAMEGWYAEGNSQRFPEFSRLAQVDEQLSLLDSAYKRLWLANQSHG